MREEIQKQFEKFSDSLSLGQVVSVHKNKYEIQDEYKMYHQAVVSGRFRYNVIDDSEYPVVGDYVVYRKGEREDDQCIIEHVLERYAELARLHEWQGKKQLLAANIDKIFICVSLNNDYNITKIQNLLSLTYGSNAETIILLTKNDLMENNSEILEEIREIAKDYPVYPVSVYREEDVKFILDMINSDTAVFIGASGVGKSTLTNALLGEEHFKTSEIRESDAQGRHTTVHREMMRLSTGGYVIDTPGIRIITSYYVENPLEHFSEIEAFAQECSFRDCTHTHEPGCKVVEAIENNELSEDRLDAYHKVLKYNSYIELKVAREKIKSKKAQKNKKNG